MAGETKPGSVHTKKLHGNELHSEEYASSATMASIVTNYLEANPPTGGLTIEQIKADSQLADSITKKHAVGSDNQDLSNLVVKVTGYSLVPDLEIAKIHSPGSDNQDLSSKVDKVTGKGLSANDLTDILKTGYDSAVTLKHSNNLDHSNASDHSHSNISILNAIQEALTSILKGYYDIAYTHSQAAHAPSNAQKNSDITKAEIEAVLTGAISSHSHTSAAFNSIYRTLIDSSGSHTAAKAVGTYGMGQGDPLAVSGTGTLYPLNVLYIDSADYPTIDGKVPKLRIRCTIECNDVAPFTGTFTVGLHPVTRPGTSGGAGLCIYTIGSAVSGSTAVGTNLAADSQNNLVGNDFALPANGWYIIAVVTSGAMATSAHCHLSAALQTHNV